MRGRVVRGSLEWDVIMDKSEILDHLRYLRNFERLTVIEEACRLIREELGAEKPTHWPEGFVEAIRIDDPAFVRPDQG